MSLKVLHIAVWESGGAGIAALRLHRGLMNEGVDSKFMCLHKTRVEKNVFVFNTRTHKNIFVRLLEKLNIPISNESKNRNLRKKFKGDYEEFTFPETDYNVLDSELVKEADIINLHWVGHYLDYPSFFKGIQKPVIWTLHDKNPTMGGFHLLLDKEKNKGMATLDDEIAENKAKWINQNNNLHIVSPSQFLMNYSKESKALKKFPHYHIRNGIDIDIFKPLEQATTRKIFNLPNDKKLVLFLNSKGYHKGRDMVLESIKSVNFKHIHFVALGEGSCKINNLSYIQSIYDERLLSLLYVAADAFLLPSREDNLPNMMLEALACGTPVLGTPIGGIPEIIEHGFNGMLAENDSKEAIKEMLQNFDNDEFKFDRLKIREYAIKHFALSIQAKNYINLYKSILI